MAALAGARTQWRAQRDAFLRRTQALLRPGALEGDDGLRPRLQTLRDEVAPAQAAAQQLQGRLQLVVQARRRAMRRELQWSLAGLLALLGLLSIAVVEPSARAASRRMQHPQTSRPRCGAWHWWPSARRPS